MTKKQGTTVLSLAAVTMGLLALTSVAATAATPSLREGLVEYWGLDGDYNAIVNPAHVGTLDTTGAGSGTFIPGKFGQGIDLKNSVGNQARVVVGGDENDFDFAGASLSFSFWFTTRSLYAQYQCLMGKGENAAWRVARVTTSGTNIKLSVSGASGVGQIDKQDGSWHHLVGTYDVAKGTTLYVDGSLVGSTTAAYTLANVPTPMWIGGNPQGTTDRAWDGALDDVAVWNRVLTAEEVAAIWNGGAGASIGELTGLGASPKPLRPSPEDEATDVQRTVVLGWAPGMYAGTHDVYLGTSRDDVNEAGRNDPRNVLVSRGQVDATYTPPVRLALGTTYYWRVDEVNAAPDNTIYKGDVWSFTTEPVAYPVDGKTITVTASSADAGQGPENTTNGSGLTGDVHSNTQTTMWLTAPGVAGPAWIEYRFDKVLRLQEMWVWNHNGLLESALGLGAKDVTVEYSTDGITYTTLASVPTFARATGRTDYQYNTVVDLHGIAAKYVKVTIRSNWGGLLPQYGLSEVRFFRVPVYVREPSPTPGKTGVSVDTSLAWRAGREAGEHRVYLGTDQQAVVDGIAAVTTVTTANVTPALGLASTYYWRVDEVNDSLTPATWPGDVWSFSTQEYLVADDFEAYTDDMDAGKAIFQTWADGFGTTTNGSVVGYENSPFAERTKVHAGKQSMPLTYNNTTVTNSETTRTFSSPQNWTLHGVKGLTLWFYGDPNNAPQQLYVKINGTKIPYDGDAANLKRAQWQMWYIDLTGRNVGSVTKLSLGLDRISGIGGAGKLLIDDLRLYSYVRAQVAPVTPDITGLQVQYQFEGNANDSSGKGRNGALQGGVTFAAGQTGQALSLDGVDDYVSVPGYKGVLADANAVQQAFTVCAWIKTATNSMDIIAWGANVNGQRMNFRVDTVLRVENGNGNMRGTNGPSLLDNEWHHVAATLPQGGKLPDLRLYVDGRDVSAPASATGAFNLTANVDVSIGNGGPMTGRFFKGLIDDARIYDRALSAGEIAGMAGLTVPYDRSF